MSEDLQMDGCCAQKCEKPPVKVRKKRDIFRFKGKEDMSVNLEHVYKMVRSGNKITFQGQTADFVDFEDEESASKAYEQILSAWCFDALEQ